jgi:thiosulfate/3-mercaptopyruvate sulfurtransferase
MQNIAESGKFLGPAELRRIYGAAGVEQRRTTTIVYCRSGMEASMTYFVLRYLGCDVSLYDGSFVEWTRGDDTPVA